MDLPRISSQSEPWRPISWRFSCSGNVFSKIYVKFCSTIDEMGKAVDPKRRATRFGEDWCAAWLEISVLGPVSAKSVGPKLRCITFPYVLIGNPDDRHRGLRLFHILICSVLNPKIHARKAMPHQAPPRGGVEQDDTHQLQNPGHKRTHKLTGV